MFGGAGEGLRRGAGAEGARARPVGSGCQRTRDVNIGPRLWLQGTDLKGQLFWAQGKHVFLRVPCPQPNALAWMAKTSPPCQQPAGL